METLSLCLSDKTKPLILGTITFFYAWSIFARNSYLYFLLGVFSTLLVELVLFWQYLGKRVHTQTGQRITVELASNKFKAKIEVRKVFSGDIGINYYEVENKMKKKKYYENNKSKPLLSVETFKPKPVKIESPAEVSLALKDDVLNAPDLTMEKSPIFSHKQINELLKMKEKELTKEKTEIKDDKDLKKPSTEDKLVFKKLGHKAFVDQLNVFLNILTCIGGSEKVYAKALSSFDSKQGFFVQDETMFEQQIDKASNKYRIKSSNDKDQAFLLKKFGKELFEKKYIYLPEWKQIKQAINFIGQVHGNCSNFVNKVSIPNINSMITEYEEKCEEHKREKKRLIKEYEEAQLNHMKLKGEYDTLHKTLEASLSEYQVKFKKKHDDEVILKHEMKARLIKSQIDSLANKLSNAFDKFQEAAKAVEIENNKIANFIRDWEAKKENVCFNILKSIMLLLGENALDAERSFEVLFLTEVKPSNNSKRTSDFDGKLATILPEEKPLEKIEPPEKLSINTGPNFPELRHRNVSSPLITDDPLGKARAPPRRQNSFKGKETEENKLVRMLDDFKCMIDEFTATYETDLAKLNEENKRSKDLSVMLKQLADYEEDYTKERSKLVSFNFLNLKVDSLATYWKMIQNNLYLINRFNTQLHERLAGLEKSYNEFIKNMEKDFKNSEIIMQNALKKASTFTKSFEKELLKREANKEKKDFFSKLFSSDDKENVVNEDAIITEKCLFTVSESFKGEVEKGLDQINSLILKYQKEVNVLKKEILVAYLQCCNGHNDLYSSLAQEADKISISNSKDDKLHQQEQKNNVGIPKAQLEEEKISNDIALNKNDGVEAPRFNEALNEEKKEVNSSSSLNLSQKEEAIHEPKEYQGADGLVWINKMFKVFALEWARSSYFKEKLIKIFFRAFNKKRSKYVRRIKIKDLIIDPKFPDIRSITPLPSDSFEFLYDFELAYQGNALLEIETRLEPQPIINIFSGDQPIPLTAKVLLKSLNAKVRFCWVPSEYGRSWFSFVGQPIINLVVEPKIGASQFDVTAIPQATSIITELINRRVRKMTYPYRKELDLPLAFRDPKIVLPPE